MDPVKREGFIRSGCLLMAFVLWTVLIQTADVQPVGVNGTNVGFAALNTWFHRLTRVHMGLYTVTDWLGLIPIAVCAGFGLLGLTQWIRRRSVAKVDKDILLLGAYYILVILGYLVFEKRMADAKRKRKMKEIRTERLLLRPFRESDYGNSIQETGQ